MLEGDEEEYELITNNDILKFLNGAFETCGEIVAKETATLVTKRNVERKN